MTVLVEVGVFVKSELANVCVCASDPSSATSKPRKRPLSSAECRLSNARGKKEKQREKERKKEDEEEDVVQSVVIHGA